MENGEMNMEDYESERTKAAKAAVSDLVHAMQDAVTFIYTDSATLFTIAGLASGTAFAAIEELQSRQREWAHGERGPKAPLESEK